MSWHEVWSRRAPAEGRDPLQTLIELDGFDSGAGRIEVDDWLEYTRLIAAKLALQPGDSVYEIGCGSGALLYPLAERGIAVGGADYAANLIEHARAAIPDGVFDATDARLVSAEPQFDAVIANSVFQYFADLDYASAVLDVMFAKARRCVAVLELPDVQHAERAERIRRDHLSEEEYERKYRGFAHQYYARDWFAEQARLRGYRVELGEQFVPNYAQNSYRFNCFFFK